MNNVDLGIYNINLINCNEIFKDTSDNIVNDLYKFDLLEKSLNNTIVKRLFIHHTILHLCEAVLKSKSNKKNILFFNNTQLNDVSLAKFYNESDIIKSICSVLRKIKATLPIKVYISRYSLDYFHHLLESNQGKGYLLLNEVRNAVDYDNDHFTFSKIKQYTKKYELTWLNEEYFNRLSTKFLLIK